MKFNTVNGTIAVFKNKDAPERNLLVGINIIRSEESVRNWRPDFVPFDFTPEQAILLGNELITIGTQLGGRNGQPSDICGECHYYIQYCECENNYLECKCNSCDNCSDKECPLSDAHPQSFVVCETCLKHDDDCICPSNCPINTDEFDEEFVANTFKHEDDEDCDECDELYEDCYCNEMCSECEERYDDCECECKPDQPEGHDAVVPRLDAFHRARYLKSKE